MGRRGIEVWGGVECTVHRIGERFGDQTMRTGHHDRSSDIALIAQLGVKKVRYPLLWERVAPDGLERADWSWSDERLGALRAAGVEPIVTLVHHGSGPRGTSLLDPQFPQKLAGFAAAVAQRYPWIRYFTPVNEPLTTARFSALYGLWYPHQRSDESFARALIHQVQAIAASMTAIREIVPEAALVQTEDLGKTYSTPSLAYQAELENERRWVTYDLLLRRDGPFIQWLRERGISDDAIARCATDVDMAGFNYYITSERFLDDRVGRYPGFTVGGNGRDAYVDVEAARVTGECSGLSALLLEAWERFHRPLAVTECHLGGTREQQLRWLEERYREAAGLAASGVDLRGFTVWALFGLVDWCSLLTRDEGRYEPGAYDVRWSPPRMTAIGSWTQARAHGDPFVHPVLAREGWWHQPDRFFVREGAVEIDRAPRDSESVIAVFGSSMLAHLVREECGRRNIPCGSDVERAWLIVDVDRDDGAQLPQHAFRGRQYLRVRGNGHNDLAGQRSWISSLLDAAIDGISGIVHLPPAGEDDGRGVGIA